MPSSLRAILNQCGIDYDVSREKVGRGTEEEDIPVHRQRERDHCNPTAPSKKDDFSAGYLSWLGVGDGSAKYHSAGINYSHFFVLGLTQSISPLKDRSHTPLS